MESACRVVSWQETTVLMECMAWVSLLPRENLFSNRLGTTSRLSKAYPTVFQESPKPLLVESADCNSLKLLKNSKCNKAEKALITCSWVPGNKHPDRTHRMQEPRKRSKMRWLSTSHQASSQAALLRHRNSKKDNLSSSTLLSTYLPKNDLSRQSEWANSSILRDKGPTTYSTREHSLAKTPNPLRHFYEILIKFLSLLEKRSSYGLEIDSQILEFL